MKISPPEFREIPSNEVYCQKIKNTVGVNSTVRKANMSRDEIIEYLSVELKKVIRDDILPAIQMGQGRGGYFSTPRLVLSCVDYLGALYCGWRTIEQQGGRPVFTATPKSIKYLEDIFGEVFAEYRVRAKLLWKIYGHGTVHLNEPKILTNGIQTIPWYLFKAGLTERMTGMRGGTIGIKDVITHLVPKEFEPGEWILPVGISCLYQDLEDSLDKYANHIKTDPNPTLENNFRSAMDEIVKPETTTLTWP